MVKEEEKRRKLEKLKLGLREELDNIVSEYNLELGEEIDYAKKVQKPMEEEWNYERDRKRKEDFKLTYQRAIKEEDDVFSEIRLEKNKAIKTYPDLSFNGRRIKSLGKMTLFICSVFLKPV